MMIKDYRHMIKLQHIHMDQVLVKFVKQSCKQSNIKDVRLNSTHFFIMKTPNQRELQQIALNHSSDIY